MGVVQIVLDAMHDERLGAPACPIRRSVDEPRERHRFSPRCLTGSGAYPFSPACGAGVPQFLLRRSPLVRPPGHSGHRRATTDVCFTSKRTCAVQLASRLSANSGHPSASASELSNDIL